MADTIALRAEDFEMPEESKLAQVFARLMRENDAVTQNGVNEAYSEYYSAYNESYGICLF